MNASNQYDYIFKIALVGDDQVGKSNIISQYCNSKFLHKYILTIGVDFFLPSLYIDSFLIRMEVWDTAGQERFRAIVMSYYRGINGFIVVYDITNRISFQHLSQWIAKLPPDVPKLIVGNKADIEEKREVSYEEAREFGEKLGIKIIEVSAKDNINLEDTFSTIARQIGIKMDLKNRQVYQIPVAVEPKPVEEEKKTEEQKEKYMNCKIVLIGDCKVGKSSLLGQLRDDEFKTNYVSTVGVDFAIQIMNYRDNKIKLQVWDTAGEQRFRSITQTYYRGADVIVFVYDITNRNSFTNLDSWLREVREKGGNETLKVVFGNKSDLEEGRAVSYDEGKAYADRIGANFFEISVKKTDNSFIGALNETFEGLGIDIQ